jgi:hypothetical protein
MIDYRGISISPVTTLRLGSWSFVVTLPASSSSSNGQVKSANLIAGFQARESLIDFGWLLTPSKTYLIGHCYTLLRNLVQGVKMLSLTSSIGSIPNQPCRNPAGSFYAREGT